MEKRKVVVGCADTIYLGKKGENLAREITFTDPLEWAELFGPGVVQLVNMRPDDTSPYPVELTMQDGCAVWAVTAADTGKVGRGSCELRYYVGDVLAKSRTWNTIVEASISDDLTDPPAPQQGWVDKVLQAGTDAQEAAKRAEDAAVRQPYPNEETGTWWVWDAAAGAYKDSGMAYGVSGSIKTDDTLTFKDGILSVNTSKKAEKDNTLPITSAAVFTEIGNIEALLAAL